MLQRSKQTAHQWLKWSEKYVNTDMTYLFKGGSWLFFAQLVVMLAGLGLASAFAHLLPKEVYGNYKFVLSIASIIGIFSLTGLGTAIVQSVSRGFDGALQMGYRSSLKWSVFLVAIAGIGSLYYFLNDNSTLSISLLIVGIALPFIQASSLYSYFLIGKKDFKTNSFYTILRNVVPILVMVTTIFFTQNIILMVLAYFASTVSVGLLTYYLTIKKYQPAKKHDWTNLPYAKHLSLMNIVSAFANHLDKILVFHYLGAAELAIYAFALLIPQQISSLFRNVATLVLPKFSASKVSTERKNVYAKSKILFVFIAVIVVLYIFAAPVIYSFLFPQYQESIIISQVAIFSMVALISLFPGIALQATKAVKEMHKTTIIASVLQIILLVPLVALYGLWGALLANIGTKFFKMLLTYYFYRTYTDPAKQAA